MGGTYPLLHTWKFTPPPGIACQFCPCTMACVVLLFIPKVSSIIQNFPEKRGSLHWISLATERIPPWEFPFIQVLLSCIFPSFYVYRVYLCSLNFFKLSKVQYRTCVHYCDLNYLHYYENSWAIWAKFSKQGFLDRKTIGKMRQACNTWICVFCNGL